MIIIRAAQAHDQAAIRALVQRGRLNFFDLDWSRFIVAEDLRRRAPVGIGQVRQHGDGAQELASIVVDSIAQGRGIGAAIVTTLMHRIDGDLYLFCRAEMSAYYARFGFVPVHAPALPGSLAWRLRVGQLYAHIVSCFRSQPVAVIAMQRR